jgi:hypothetical protein
VGFFYARRCPTKLVLKELFINFYLIILKLKPVKQVCGSGCVTLAVSLGEAVLLQVGPVPVLVMSLLFIACVFMLHIWGKYNRA